MTFGIVSLIYMYKDTFYKDNIITGSFALVFIIAILQFALTLTQSRLKEIKLKDKNSDFELTKRDLKKITLRYQLNYFSITCVLVGILNMVFSVASGFENELSILWTAILIVVPFWGYFETKKNLSKNYSIGENYNLTQTDDQFIIDSGKRKYVLDSQKDKIRLRIDNLIMIQQESTKDLHILRLND